MEERKKCFLCGNSCQNIELKENHKIIHCYKCGKIPCTDEFVDKFISKETGLLKLLDFDSETGYLSEQENEESKSALIYYFKNIQSKHIEPITLSSDNYQSLISVKDSIELHVKTYEENFQEFVRNEMQEYFFRKIIDFETQQGNVYG